MKHSLERIHPYAITAAEQETLALHLERYRFAALHIAPGVVADIACGVGYGSYLLATEAGEKIEHIVAVDSDRESINIANERYAHSKISYHCADAVQFESGQLFQTLISLETLEHLQNPVRFVEHISAQLAPGGRFIISVPVTPSMDANPFHLQDFTEKTITELFQKAGYRLLHKALQEQRFSPKIIVSENQQRAQLRKNIFWYYLKHPYKFFLRLQSLLRDGFCNKYLLAVFEKQ